MTYSQIEKEREEFERIHASAYKEEIQPGKGLDNINQELEKTRRRRTIEQWAPERLLCKRFGVNPPWKGKVKFLSLNGLTICYKYNNTFRISHLP